MKSSWETGKGAGIGRMGEGGEDKLETKGRRGKGRKRRRGKGRKRRRGKGRKGRRGKGRKGRGEG
jgi:hypothetical protein